MDIVKRLKAKPPKGFVTSPLMIEAADEIERLQLREETLSGIIDGMTARFIEAQRAIEEIERLRQQNAELLAALKDMNGAGYAIVSIYRAAIAKATGGE